MLGHKKCVRGFGSTHVITKAAVAQLGERQTEDLKVPGSIPGGGIYFFQNKRYENAFAGVRTQASLGYLNLSQAL